MSKKFTMPSALSIVMIFLVFVAVLTWFVPTSVVVGDEEGNSEIIYNASFDDEGNVIENAGTDPAGLWDIFMAPVLGLREGVNIAAAIIVSGGFVAVLNKTGALDAGVCALLRRFSGSGMIIMLMTFFAAMGTVYGLWDGLPAFAVVIIPVITTAGYDAVTGMLVLLVGAVAGNMAGVVNPYAVGAAVSAIGNDELSIGDGIVLRMVLFVVLLTIGCLSVLKYAGTVRKKTPAFSASEEESMPLTGRHKASLIVFALVNVFTIMGYAPWDALNFGDISVSEYINSYKNLSGTFVGNIIGVDVFNEFGSWGFAEFTTTWLAGAVLIAVINKMPEKEFAAVFIKGAANLMGVILVLAVSRGIGIFMGSGESGMSVTFIYWVQNLLTGVPLWAFVVAAIAVYILIALAIHSTTAIAGITMPVFSAIALSLFAMTGVGGESGQVVLISAFTVGVNFTNGLYPDATNMGLCEMTGVSYPVFFRTMLKILLPMLITAALIISAAPYIGLA